MIIIASIPNTNVASMYKIYDFEFTKAGIVFF